jgi:hypothetical protein
VLNLDLSKAIPRTTLSYLTALIPGLFFAISILVGNPEFVGRHLERAQNYLPLRPYVQLAIALFLAFIVGSASMLLVGFIQHLLTYLHSLRLILLDELARWPVLPFLRWLGKFRFVTSRAEYYRLYTRAAFRASDPRITERYAYRAWDRMAQKLMRDRYGVELHRVEEEWQFIFWSLGTFSDVEWRGPLLMIAFEATGWCGLAAIQLAPALSNRYYLALCLLFIVTGLHNDYWVAGRRIDPVAVALRQTRALLREYEKDRQPSANIHKRPEGDDKPEP